MTTPLSGIEKWVTSIRSRMANDPGRQDLEDHILCNGFLFLQEYMEDILSGTKSEPIIELTKTPGRRRDISKKDKLEKAKHFSESPEKENIDIFSHNPRPPFQALEKQKRVIGSGLSKAEKPKSVSHQELKIQSQNLWSNGDEEDEQAVENLVTPPSASLKNPDLEVSPMTLRTVKFSMEPETIENEPRLSGTLSVIAEGDEQEALHTVTSPRKGLVIGKREISYQIPKDPDDPDGPMATIVVPYSEDDRSFDDSEPTSTISSFPIDPYARDYETHELPKIVPVASPRSEEKPPTPVPASNLMRKASVPVFPILPPPSPMRKTRESVDISNGVSGVGGVGGVGTKPNSNGGRTSWLQKARDVTAKHGGVKRKSDEMLEDYGRSTEGVQKSVKLARTEDNNADSFSNDKVPPKPVIQPFKPVTKPRDPPPPPQTQLIHSQVPHEDTEGMMDVLKRTVEGLGARVGKGLGKSLGGAAANAAAAEAKAAAEARLAQREVKGSDGVRQSRPSVSELVGVYESGSTNDRDLRECHSKPLTSTSPIAPRLLLDRASIASTSSNSPPPPAPIRIVSQNSIPQFQVQRPPLKEFNGSQSQSQGYSQSSTQSTYVSNLFGDNPTWTQSSFATEYTATQTFSQSQSQYSQPYQDDVIDSQHIRRSGESKQPETQEHTMANVYHEVEDEEEMVLGQDVVPHVVNSQPAELKDNQSHRTVSQSSDEKPQGFVAQASSMISKVMGSATLKRMKPEPVKSIQLAAVAAKKQQEEAEKKAARLKEMEKRRAVIASKKAEQDAAEKSKLQKRDREDDITKTFLKKTDDDTMKKRKVVVEIEKKPVNVKKPPSKDKINSVSTNAGVTRPLPKTTPSSKTPLPPTSVVKAAKQTGSNQLELKTPMPASSSKLQASQSKPNLKEAAYDDMRQPSETLQAQMHARVQAQIAQAKRQEPQEQPIPSESIELPDINSEYSNSDDEDRPRTFDPPDWAQSPVLAQALQSQSRLNPDDIFGPVRPLRMDEIFKKNTSRFRARTSSANWVGTDELTKEEEKAYAKRMGYVEF